MGAIVVSRAYQQKEPVEALELPYYSAQEWSEVCWRETIQSGKYRYRPYVIWAHLPFVGEMANIKSGRQPNNSWSKV